VNDLSEREVKEEPDQAGVFLVVVAAVGEVDWVSPSFPTTIKYMINIYDIIRDRQY